MHCLSGPATDLKACLPGPPCRDPVVIFRVLFQVGPTLLLGWFRHFAALVAYSLGHALLSPLRRWVPASRAWRFHRLLDALEYGSGADCHYHPGTAAAPPAGAPAAGAAAQEGAA